MIEIGYFSKKGRGVILTKKGLKGDVLERAPISCFPASQRHTVNMTDVFDHYFVIQEEYLKSNYTTGYIVYGLTSIVNHAIHPNAIVEWDINGEDSWAVLRLTVDLESGEEITIAYSNIDEYKNTSQWVA